MQIKSYFTTCTAQQPHGHQARLADLAQSSQSASQLQDLQLGDQFKVSGRAQDNTLPAPISFQNSETTQSSPQQTPEQTPAESALPDIDFNLLKQGKQILKTAGEGLRSSGFNQTGRNVKQLARGVGVVGHGGRAYEKFSDGKYLDGSKESAQAIKEGVRLMGKTLPTGAAQGLNGVISAAVIAKYYDYLLALSEDPSAENLDRFLTHSKQVMQNVDDVYELGKFLVGFARTQGPGFAERLGLAISRSEAKLGELNTSTLAAGTVPAQSRIERASLMIMAGLDVSRVLLAGVQAVQEPDSSDKMGVVLKRSTTALLSLAALKPETGWVPGALALGTELIPDRAFGYLAENLWDYSQPSAPKNRL